MPCHSPAAPQPPPLHRKPQQRCCMPAHACPCVNISAPVVDARVHEAVHHVHDQALLQAAQHAVAGLAVQLAAGLRLRWRGAQCSSGRVGGASAAEAGSWAAALFSSTVESPPNAACSRPRRRPGPGCVPPRPCAPHPALPPLSAHPCPLTGCAGSRRPGRRPAQRWRRWRPGSCWGRRQRRRRWRPQRPPGTSAGSAAACGGGGRAGQGARRG